MKMKKVLSLIAAGALAFGALAGCGANSDSTTKGEKVYNVGLCQLVQHDALDKATKGFQDVLTEKLGDKVKFDFQNAAGDSATCATIANQFVSSGVDLIFANATPSLQAAATATSTIPVVGTSITNYGVALDISDFKDTTGRNVTGTADLAPLEKQAEMFKELLPNAKKIGLLYCSSEANSKYQIDVVSAELKKLGYETKEYAFADSNDIAAVVTTACGEVDAMYAPTDNTVAANTEIVANIVIPAKVPVITGESGICEGCGVATLSISYYDIGKKAGEMAYDILVNGADPATMKIEYAEELTKKYDKARAEAMGIKVPEDYVELTAE